MLIYCIEVLGHHQLNPKKWKQFCYILIKTIKQVVVQKTHQFLDWQGDLINMLICVWGSYASVMRSCTNVESFSSIVGLTVFAGPI